MITEKSHLKAKQFDVSKRLAAVGYPQTLVRKGDREKAYSNAAVTCQIFVSPVPAYNIQYMCFLFDQQKAIFEDETFQIRIHELGLEKTSTNKLIK